jgi:hypothetical protein
MRLLIGLNLNRRSRFEVLMTVTLKTTALWDVTLCGLLDMNQRVKVILKMKAGMYLSNYMTSHRRRH